MAATEPISFDEPAQLGGSSFGFARLYLNHDLPLQWRYACLLAVARLALQGQEPRR